MKRLASLLFFSLLFGLSAKAQYIYVSIYFTDTFNVAPNFTVNATVRNTDSVSNPNALTLVGSYANGGGRTDSFAVSSGYTVNQITVNYQDCGIWKSHTFTHQNGVSERIILQCSPNCEAPFSHYDTALTSTFVPASFHQSFQHTWYFGDGDSSNLQAVNHTYSQPGVYYAQHKVRAANGHCEEILGDTMRVSYPCNSQFTLSANARNILVQSQLNHAYLSHAWNFGDGQTSNSANPSHTYSQDGAYGLSHTVTDLITNCTSTSYDTVYINTNCDAYFGIQAIQVSDNFVRCKDSSIIISNYPTTYTWDFGDSTTGSGSYVYHAYQRPDSFTIKLRLQNGSCIDSFSRRVGLGQDCGTATISHNTYSFDSLRHNFFVSNARPFTTYTWKIEDSTYTKGGLIHIFQHTGPHVIKLNWDNGHGCRDSASMNLNVTVDTQVYITQHKVYQITPGAAWYRVELAGGGYKSQQLVVLDFQDTILGLNAGSYWFPSAGWHFIYYKVYNNFTSASAIDSFYVTDTSQCKLVLERLYSSDSNLVRYSTLNSAINTFGNHVSYLWDLDGGEFRQFYPSAATYVFFPDSGTYTIRLELNDSNGYCVHQRDSIQVYVPRKTTCNADFSYTYVTPNTVSFSALSRNYSNAAYRWEYNNQSSPFSGPDQTRSFSQGLQLVRLKITSGNCRDTVEKWISINTPCTAIPMVNSIGNFVFELKTEQAHANMQETKWYISSSNSTDSIQSDSFRYTFPGPGSYTLITKRLDDNGVQICGDTLYFQVTNCGSQVSTYDRYFVELEFDGQVLTDFDSMRVYFIWVDSTNWIVGAIDSITLYSGIDSGIWVDRGCIQAPRGYTLVKGALLPGSKYYSDYLPTYMTHSALWTGSDKITFNYTGWQMSYTLNMIKGTNPGGPGFIGGFINQGANKNGAGLDGIQVNLFDQNDKPVAVTYTFNAGRYEFNNLAYGTYKVSVDVPGKSTASYFITISASNESSDEMNFEVNSRSVDIVSTSVQLPANSFRIYPNPVKDKLYIESASSLPVSKSLVRDLQGRLIPVATKNNLNSLELNLGDLPMGIYFVYVYSNEAFTVYKITKSE